jgi:hypothetical protein
MKTKRQTVKERKLANIRSGIEVLKEAEKALDPEKTAAAAERAAMEQAIRDTVSINGRRVKPNGDVITQSDLAAVRDTHLLMQRLGANLARRLDLGATVEYGALLIDDYYEPEIGSEPGDPVDEKLVTEYTNTPLCRIDVSLRNNARQILGRVTKQAADAA